MTKLAELMERRTAIGKEMAELNTKAEGRAFSEEEQTTWDKLKADRAAIDQQIERESELQEEQRKAAKTEIDKGGTKTEVGDPQPYRNLGDNVAAAVRSAVSMRSRGGELEPRLRQMDEEVRAATGAGETVGSEGGFLIEKQILTDLMSKAYGGEILSNVSPIPIGPGFNGITLKQVDETSRATGSRYGGIQMYWAGEGDTVTASKPKYKSTDLKLQKLMGVSYSTDELMQDSSAHGALLERAFSEEAQFMLENGIFQGTGGAQPLGILNAGCLISQAKVGGQTAATVVSTNISAMWKRVWARSRPNAIWLYNQQIETQLDELIYSGALSDLASKVLTMGADGVQRIKNRPAVAVEYCAALGTEGDIVVADFTQYIAIDKGGLQTAVSIHVQFLEDETTIRFVYRFNGQPAWDSALTPFSGGETVGPFVSLAVRA